MATKEKKELKPIGVLKADEPAKWDPADVRAIQQLHAGEATPDQQRRALMWILTKASGANDVQFRLGGIDGQRETDFGLGRAFVGQQILGILKINLGAILNLE